MTTSELSQATLFEIGSAERREYTHFPTPAAYDANDVTNLRKDSNAMEGGRHSVSLTHLIANGLDASTSSQPLIPASHSLSPGSDWARRMTAISGRRCAASLPTSGLVASWLRTLLGTSRWASTRCWLTWKRSATPAGRLLFRLVPSMPSTAEIASGFWPTPLANAMKGPGQHGDGGPNLQTVVAERGMWPKPRMEGFDAGAHRGSPDSLHSAVKLLPTPTVQDAKNNAGPSQFNRNSDPLNVVAVKTATRDGLWTTPCADDTGHRSSRYAQGGTALSAQAGGKLHGRWTLALMGFPPDWCDDLPPDPLAGDPT